MQYQNIAFLFPGQGAQYPGMGKDFAKDFAIAHETFEEAEDVLGRNLSSLIFEGPDATLMETRHCQVAIYVVSIAVLRVLQSLYPQLRCATCAGLSLGEYTALTASGRLDFGATLPLVQARGQAMHDACEAHQGGMAVVMGLENADVEALVAELNLPKDLWAANFNCPGQVVISGTKKGVDAGTAAAKKRGAKRVVNLPVHGAFHSGLMAPAEHTLATHVTAANIQSSDIAYVMNVPGDYVEGIENVRRNLIEQITRPVRWEQGIRAMMAHGVDLFVEIGCGKSLAGMNRRIGATAPTVSVEKISDLAKLEQLDSMNT